MSDRTIINVTVYFEGGTDKNFQFDMGDPLSMESYRRLMARDVDTIDIPVPYYNEEHSYGEVVSHFTRVYKSRINFINVRHTVYANYKEPYNA